MPLDEGMLFSFPRPDYHSFWMRNTSVPLSIAFIDQGGKIVDIDDLEPFNENSISPSCPVCYALEMNRGWFRDNEITRGDYVRDLPSLPLT